ncbi:hypothetical protein AB0D38_39895 [Streptomyces sp. NPDC048279]|uniref:hypothetical protein n=1 Tax=Streptomyces sp. NPDC048279 TaxID=3154714 RepID=UPI00343A38AB
MVRDDHADPLTGTVTVTVGRPRRELGAPRIIVTTPGVRYRIVDPAVPPERSSTTSGRTSSSSSTTTTPPSPLGQAGQAEAPLSITRSEPTTGPASGEAR